MKKILSIALILMLCLAAAATAEETVTLQDMILANDFSTLLAQSTIGISTVRYGADGVMTSNDFVSVADGLYSYEYNGTEYIFVDDDNGVYEYSDANGSALYTFMLQSDYETFSEQNETVTWIPSTFANIEDASFRTENGVLYMEYQTANENELASLAEFGDVTALHYVCEADPATRIINYITVYAVTSEGETPIMEVGYMYGIGFAVDESLLNSVFGGDTRKITYIVNGGTEDEIAVSFDVTKGCAVNFVSYKLGLYADADCTVPYEDDGDMTTDRVIYVG